jgi:hypothetical protein
MLYVFLLTAPVKAQMNLTPPQQRMYEPMRDVNNLNEAANRGARKQEKESRISFFRLALVAGAFWLYGNRRRVEPGNPVRIPGRRREVR